MDLVAPSDRRSVTIAGIAIIAALLLAGVLRGVWSIDDHFITRREFGAAMADVNRQLAAIDHKIGVRPPPRRVPADQADE